jgi:hypothetical protein
MDELRLPKIPEGYRIWVGTFLGLPKVKLQKKGRFFWKTVDTLIPVSNDRDANELIQSAAARLIREEYGRTYNEAQTEKAIGIYYASKAQNQTM